MNCILVYICVICWGMLIARPHAIPIDWSKSVRLRPLMLFALHNMVKGVKLVMQARRYKAIMEAVESFVRNALAIQVLDDSDPDYGGFRCPDHLVCEPWAAVNTFTTMTILFFNPNSQYYRSPELFRRMKLALYFITRTQNGDGTMNVYFSGEIKTVSNLGLVMHSLMKAYRLFSRAGIDEESLRLLESFLGKGAGALKLKPVSSATQRWSAASALVDYDKMFIDHLAVSKAETYISDRVDINHDGLYGDRSPAYSMVSNAMLLNIAKKMNRPYLIECVRRNLNFSLYNFYSDGEVVTEYSLTPRLEGGMPQGYAVWKEMSIIDHNGYYALAGDMVLDVFLSSMRDGYANYYINDPAPDPSRKDYSRFFATSSIGELLLTEDELNNNAVNRLPLPNHYEKVFSNSNIARIRNGKMSATIMGNNSILFALHNGRAIIDSFRIRYIYFGHRNFVPKKLEASARSYVLQDWFNFWQPDSGSEKVEPAEADLKILTEFIYKGDGFDIDVSATGLRGIPLQLEFGIRKQGTIIANGREYDLSNTDLIPMDRREATIKVGDDRITIWGGMAQHKIYSYDDGSSKNLRTTSLMITPLTPFSGKIQIICG